jgi:hypothetical protein
MDEQRFDRASSDLPGGGFVEHTAPAQRRADRRKERQLARARRKLRRRVQRLTWGAYGMFGGGAITGALCQVTPFAELKGVCVVLGVLGAVALILLVPLRAALRSI